MQEKRRYVFLAIAALLAFSGCSKPQQGVVELKRFPIDSLDGIITRSGAVLDKDSSADGKGSLRIIAQEPTTVRLFEISDLEIENARLTYAARVRTEKVEGQVYLEMWCRFPGKGEFFSRSLQSPLTGTMSWASQETPFFLKKGEKPDLIKLNIVINGKGIVWIDDIRLWKGPLS